ncbi:MAG: SUMF1/EgtB/PvdO family nonheme iron enzyme [Acidobacteriota bacterium]
MRPLASFTISVILLAGVPAVALAQSAGDLYPPDSIVGTLRYAPATGAGGFVQGSPVGESCRGGDEAQFTHVLTRNLAVMETGVTRQMWADLRAAQPTLPADPTALFYSSGSMTDPVQNNTWYEAVLLANLLSAQQGLTRCYYTDSSKTVPVDSTNYIADSLFCDFTANGYRLPTEGEREYFARAGTTGPFSVSEPNYSSTTCSDCSWGLLPSLDSVAWFCNHGGFTSHPVGTKAANPWSLKDVHGHLNEWCWDVYGTYPAGAATDFAGPTWDVGAYRVLRGTFWYNDASHIRSATRDRAVPQTRYPGIGFRLVRTVSAFWINAIKSKTSKAGTRATIRGVGFSTNPKKDTVYFGSKKADISKATTTSLKVTIPRKCPKGQVYVRVVIGTQSSDLWPFVVK